VAQAGRARAWHGVLQWRTSLVSMRLCERREAYTRMPARVGLVPTSTRAPCRQGRRAVPCGLAGSTRTPTRLPGRQPVRAAARAQLRIKLPEGGAPCFVHVMRRAAHQLRGNCAVQRGARATCRCMSQHDALPGAAARVCRATGERGAACALQASAARGVGAARPGRLGARGAAAKGRTSGQRESGVLRPQALGEEAPRRAFLSS
jgi:hypothetical protein